MNERIRSAIPTPRTEVIDELERLIREVVEGLDDGRDCSALITSINELSGFQRYNKDTFFQLYSWTSEREFAELAAMGRPPAIPDLTVDEVAECLRIVLSAEEPEASYCLGILQQSFPTLSISDHIYWPEQELEAPELAEEIVKRASTVGS